MSDYYGAAQLESWLANEGYDVVELLITPDIVAKFEKWRLQVEQNIESWMSSGDEYPTSWRDWGRGYSSIPDEDENELNLAYEYGLEKLSNVNKAVPALPFSF